MFLGNWLLKLRLPSLAFGGIATSLGRRRKLQHSVPVEQLEDRIVPAFYMVTTADDTNGTLTKAGHAGTVDDPYVVTTLRTAINSANLDAEADTIVFDPILTASAPAYITMNIVGETSVGRSAFIVSTDITIMGPTMGSNGIVLNGANAIRLFNVSPTGTLTLDSVTLTNGRAQGGNGYQNPNIQNGNGGGGAGLGGAIFVQGTLNLVNSTLSGNTAAGGHGGPGNTFGGGYGGGGIVGSSYTNGTGTGGHGGRENGGSGGAGVSGGNGSDGGLGGGGGGGGQGVGVNGGSGGDGGFGGGGGGGGYSPSSTGGAGGAGGFGGGGGGGGGGTTAGTGSAGGFAGGVGAAANSATHRSGAGGGGAGMGGAIFNAGGTITIANSTIANNTAEGGDGNVGGGALGGGIFNLNGNITLLNTTIASNTVTAGAGGSPTADGGALYTMGLDGTPFGTAAGASITSRNSLLVNSSGTTHEVMNNNSAISASSSLISQGSASGFTTVTTAALNLGPLQYNGGPTQTMALGTSSVAINAGNNSFASSLTRDQRGYVRVSNTTIDVGAFETQSASVVINYVASTQTLTVFGLFSGADDITITSASNNSVRIALDSAYSTIVLTGDASGGDFTLDGNSLGLTINTASGHAPITVFNVAMEGGDDTLDFSLASSTPGVGTALIDMGDGTGDGTGDRVTLGTTHTDGALFSYGGATTVSSNATISTNGGAIGITGFGISTARVGLSILSGATLNAGGGNVTLAGTGSAVSYNGSGLELRGTVQTSGTGSITITGTGGNGSGSNNPGVVLTTGASVSAGNGGVRITGTGSGNGSNEIGVNIGGGATVSATSTGAVTITGTGGANGSYSNFGVVISDSSTKVSAASGLITITGTGGGGTSSAILNSGNQGVLIKSNAEVSGGVGGVTITGNGKGASSFEHGVTISSFAKVSATTTGAVSITGTGSAKGSYGNYGVFLNNGGVSAESGLITITGTGGGGSSSAAINSANHGVLLLNESEVRAGAGGASITGYGKGSAAMEYGVYFLNGAVVSATSTGAVSITGTGSANGTYDNRGVNLNASTILAESGPITITGTGGGGTNPTGGVNSGNVGVSINGNAAVSGGDGLVTISGYGGGHSSSEHGVEISSGAVVEATLSGLVYITGTGNANSSTDSLGVVILDTGTKVSAGAGGVTIEGTGGGTGSGNQGVLVTRGAAVVATLSGGVSITGNGSVNGTNDSTGVVVSGTGTTVSAADGGVTITGTGGGTTSDNHGVDVIGGAAISSTLSGDVSITGYGSAHGVQNGYGLYLYGSTTSVTTVDGDIDLTGTGQSKSGSFGQNTNIGLYLGGGIQVSSTDSGNITITGTGSNGPGNKNWGVKANAQIQAAAGDITIAGTGRGNGAQEIGTLIFGGLISASATGSLSITGTGSATGSGGSSGVYLSNATINATLQSVSTSIITGTATNNTGIVIESGTALNLTLGFAPTHDMQLTVAESVGSEIDGTFSNIADDVTITLSYNGQDYRCFTDYTGGASHTDLVLFARQALDLSVESNSDTVTTAVPGQTVLTYVIVVKGDATNPVVGAKITDLVPAGLTGVTYSSVTSGTVSGNTTNGSGSINDTVNLGIGATITYTVMGTVAADATGTLVNTATITVPHGFEDNNSANDSLTDTDTLTPQTDVSVTKDDSSLTAVPGQTTTYTIIVSNSGPSTATATSLIDNFIAPVTNATWTSSASVGASGNTLNSSGNINETLTLAPGSSVTYTVTATIAADATGTLTNTATVSQANDTTPGNDSAADSDTLTPQTDVSVTKNDSSSTAVPGQTTTYTIVVSNSGPSVATATSLIDTFTAPFTGATWTSSATAGASGNTLISSGNINESLTLAPGSSVTYTVIATIDASATGTLTNTTTVSQASDTTPGNNTASDTDTLTPRTDVSVTKNDGRTSVIPGQTTTYTIVVSNSGPSTATATQLVDNFQSPISGATWTSSASAGASGNSANGSGNINQSLTLAPGSSVTYTVIATIGSSPALSLSNTATVSQANDTNGGNNSSTDVDTVFTPPALAVAGNITYTEGNPPTFIASAITVSDVDSPTLRTATVTMTNYIAGQDVLSFTRNGATMGDIAVLSNSNGVLRLSSPSGTATLVQWQAALRAVQYSNTSKDPNPNRRNVSFVANDGMLASNTLVSTVSVVATNDAPTALSLSSTTIAENNRVNDVVGTLSATDPDVGAKFTYSLISGAGDADNASFLVTGNLLKIKVVTNFEAKSSYQVRVRVSDQFGATFDQQFTITVTNVNEAPTNLFLSSTTLQENNLANAIVGTLSADDPDAGSTFTYKLASGIGDADNSKFTVTGDTLRIKSSANFESQSSYKIRLMVTDQGGLTFAKTFVIQVTDVNEAPTNITLSSTTLSSTNTGTTVGTLGAQDPDATSTFTFSLVSGDGSTDNASLSIVGNTLKFTPPPNATAKSSYAIRIRVTDQGDLTFDKTFVITVTQPTPRR